jgi:hypothetical protein
MPMWKAVLAAGLAICFVCGAAWAETVKFTASLAPESPGTNGGKGTATLSLDTTSKTLTWIIEYFGLSAPPEMAALLSPPAKPNGEPGTVPLTLPPNPTSPINGAFQLSDPQIAGLKTGKWLLLIGTQQAPEIGGEVKPAP